MYMYMSSTISLRERRYYCLSDCCCDHLVDQQGSIRTLSFTAACARVSRGLRQSALLCNPTFRRGVGYNGCRKLLYKQDRFACVLYAAQERRFRCLGWEEEEEEEEDCLEGLQSSGIAGEVREMLNLLMEDRRRRVQVSKRRKPPLFSAGTQFGTGRGRREKTHFTGQAVAGKASKQMDSVRAWDDWVDNRKREWITQEPAGKRISTCGTGRGSRAEESLFGKTEGLLQEEEEELVGKGTSISQTASTVEQRLLGKTEGLSRNREGRVRKGTPPSRGSPRAEQYLFGKKEGLLCNSKETILKSTGESGSESLLNDLSEVRLVSTVESQRQEETAIQGTGKSVVEVSQDDLRSNMRWVSSLESQKQEERVQKGTRQNSWETSLNDLNTELRCVSPSESSKQEEAIQKCVNNSGSDIPLNDLSSNLRWASMVETPEEEKAQKGMKEVSSETSVTDLRSNARWVSTAESEEQDETIKRSPKKSVPEIPSKGLSSNIRWISAVESRNKEETSLLEKQESSGVGLGSVEESREQLEETVQKDSGTLIPAVPSDHLRKNTGCVSVTQLEEHEAFEKTTEILVFKRKDELVRHEQRSSSAQLEEEKDSTEEGVKPASKVLASQPTGVSASQMLFWAPANKLGSKEVLNSATELEKEESHAGYETAQKNFAAPFYKLACSEVFGAASELEKSKSTASYETENNTSQKLFKAPSSKMAGNDCLGSEEVEKKISTTDYEMGNKPSQKMFKDPSYELASDKALGLVAELEKKESGASCETGHKTSQKLFKDPSYKLASNEVLGSTTDLVTKKPIADVETKITAGKSLLGRQSDESECSLGMVSAEGTENLASAARTSEESPLDASISQQSSEYFVSKGPSDEVWAVAGWSSWEEHKELQSPGLETAEKPTKTLACEGPSDKLPKNKDCHSSADSEEEKSTTLKSTGKAIVKRPSRWLWSTFAEFCRKGWHSHAEPENCTLESGSGGPSTESPGSEDWFSVPELEDQGCTPEEKSDKPREKSLAKRKGNDLISNAGLNPIADLKEADGIQQGKAHEPARKWSSDELPLPRRRARSTGYGEYEWVERGNGKGMKPIADSKKTEGKQQVNAQKAAGKWALEGSLDELSLPKSCVPETGHEENDQLERRKGKATLENNAELEEQKDKERFVECSKIKEKKNEPMTIMFKRNKQVSRETFALWEEALLLENEQRQEDEKFMKEALLEARLAADAWEVPVGAVLVQHGRIIARAHNLVEENRDATAHAELLCIRDASNQLRTWRLADSTLYVTLEPCAMCAGALLQARVGTVVWGAPNRLLGADGSWISLFPRTDEQKISGPDEEPLTTGPIHPFHPNIKVRRGVLANDCSDVMQQFFKLRRKKDKKTESATCFPLASYPTKLYTKIHEIFSMMFCL